MQKRHLGKPGKQLLFSKKVTKKLLLNAGGGWWCAKSVVHVCGARDSLGWITNSPTPAVS
jgi:hypothetical protein